MRHYDYMLLLRRPAYFLLTIGLLFLMLYLTSCEFEQIGPEGVGQAERLSGQPGSFKKWKLDYYMIDGQRVYPSYCDEDNEIIFYYDGDYTLDRGYDACYYNESDADYGSWHFTNRQSRLLISTYGVQNEYDILTLTNRKLELSLYSLGSETISSFTVAY